MTLLTYQNLSNEEFNEMFPLKEGHIRFFSYRATLEDKIVVHDVDAGNSWTTAEDHVKYVNMQDDRNGNHSYAFLRLSDCISSLEFAIKRQKF